MNIIKKLLSSITFYFHSHFVLLDNWKHSEESTFKEAKVNSDKNL